MSGAIVGAVQLSAIAVAPLLPGLIQHLKGRLQGRPGPTPLQPYRELRRLWGKSRVSPEPRTVVYELAPAVVAASVLVAILLVPVGGRSGGWPVGNDAIVLVGLLALGRFAITLSAWDTGGGFGLMGAGRDLTFAVAAEAVLLLVLVTVALPTGSTDLVALSDAGAWSEPGHWAAALAFGLVVLAETGRQPVDNPDTHLELTMVHEGPLLEYAGRDLAYLGWAAAARHWVVLALAAGLYLPHPGDLAGGLAAMALAMTALVAGLGLVETWHAKMRLLRVPPVLLAGVGIALLGLVSEVAGVAG
jgi:formate hydrogenlyase subunit 4